MAHDVVHQDVERDDADDGVQHGIDDNPAGDAKKGAALGGIGGVAVGAAAGSVLGPVGALVGAAIGGAAGAAGSGAAVAAVDRVDNDDTVSGLGDGVTPDADTRAPGNRTRGIQTGGRAAEGTPDTRGIAEKTEDAVTGDRYDDKTGKPVV